MNNFIVTTSYRPTKEQEIKAKQIAKEENMTFVQRNKRSITKLMDEYNQGVIVVSTKGIMATAIGSSESLFFHPNVAMLRVKRWLKSKNDPFVEACKIKEGDVFLDTTLGMGSDAILASLASGKNGRVIGVEESFPIALVVREGLASYETSISKMNEAMRKIEVVHQSHLSFLQSLGDKSVDIVYFDPMFTETVKGSNGIEQLRLYAKQADLSEEVMREAKRVARKRIVLKDHFRSIRFKQFGFHVNVRPSATYHFGIIEMEENR